MPILYPPAPPTISGDLETINRFLNSPTLIQRRLRSLAEQRFISDALLTSRFPAAGGAVIYEQNESIFTDRTPEQVAPGSEFPQTTAGTGPAQIAAVVKWGQDVPVTDEAIKRLNIDPVNRAMIKLVNQMVSTIDGLTMSAIVSAATQTQAASGGSTANTGGWRNSAATILRDAMLAKATILGLKQGYDPDTLVVDDVTFAYVASDPTIVNALRREDGLAPVYTGEFPTVAGLRVLPTPNLPGAGTSSAVALVLDSKLLGAMVDEQLGGPGYTGAVQGVESKTIREDKRDRWLLRARRVTVPIVQEPAAVVKITGVTP